MENASEHLARLEEVFHDVSAVDLGARPARLLELCGDDAVLLAEVSNLLRAAERERLTSGARRERQQVEDAAFGQRRIGPYQLQSLLGRGGTGAVYLARRADDQYEKTVAIKLIDVPLTTELFRDRFRRERQILAGLDHPLIARLLDGGVSTDGSPYLVMDYVAGVPIDQFCRHSKLSMTDRISLFLRVCEAVQFAHRNLVVHRDLKPDNILVSSDGVPHLLDFGTAKLLSPEEPETVSQSTRDGFISFTPQYASPEQVLGQPVTIASDIYSLAVLLFVLLTGANPYELASFSTEEMVRVICHQAPRRLRSVAAVEGKRDRAPDADLEAIVMMSMRKEPHERYATVEHFSADLQAWLENRPVKARQGDAKYRAFKFARRHLLGVTAPAILTITAATGALGILLQSHRANQERMRAEERSANLRQLSSSLLADIDDAVTRLPGSTPVQKLLVNRVVDHLDRLAADARDDDSSELQMLSAYTILANVQGNPYHPNIGDLEGAMQSLDKATTFANALHASVSQDPDILQAYAREQQARSELLFALGRETESETALKSAVPLFERRLQKIVPSAGDLVEMAAAYNALGDQRNRRGADDPKDKQSSSAAYRVALGFMEQAVRLEPASETVLRSLSRTHMKLGSALVVLDPINVYPEEQLAVASLDALPEPQRSAPVTQTARGWIDREVAIALWQQDRFAEALDAFAKECSLERTLVETDPKNSYATYWYADCLQLQSEVHVAMLHPSLGLSESEHATHRASAERLLRTAVLLLDHLTTQSPANVFWRAAFNTSKARLGSLAVEGLIEAKSDRSTSEAIAELRHDASRPETPLFLLDSAVQTSLRIEPGSLREAAWTLDAAERMNDRTQHQRPFYLWMLAQAANDAGRRAEATAAAEEGIRILPIGPNASPTPTLSHRLLKWELARSSQQESPLASNGRQH